MSDEAEFLLGLEAEKFIQSDLGKYINGCIQQDIESAKQELSELDPYKYTTLPELQNAITEIQNRSRASKDLYSYISEAINRGIQAEHQLDQEDH